MTAHKTVHATFVLERTYRAAPARVFAAWSDPRAKARWFVGPDEWKKSEHTMDFRVGGTETVSGGPVGGPVHTFSSRYQDIVPGVRIVSTYDMHLGEQRISVSLATVEIAPQGTGTKLTYTEQGVFLDGYDDAGSREEGTRGLLDQLGVELDRQTDAR